MTNVLNFGPELDAVYAAVQKVLVQTTQILHLIGTPKNTTETVLSNQEAMMATEADVQAAADAIAASITSMQTDLTAEDGAIAKILAWVQANPGTIPDALVTELQNAKTAVDTAAGDITTHTTSLTAGTPA